MSELTHLDDAGNAHMVDVADKAVTDRKASARAIVAISDEVAQLIRHGDVPKGDALAVARIEIGRAHV